MHELRKTVGKHCHIPETLYKTFGCGTAEVPLQAVVLADNAWSSSSSSSRHSSK